MRIYLYDLILKKEIKIKINFDILCTQKKKKKKKSKPSQHGTSLVLRGSQKAGNYGTRSTPDYDSFPSLQILI